MYRIFGRNVSDFWNVRKRPYQLVIMGSDLGLGCGRLGIGVSHV